MENTWNLRQVLHGILICKRFNAGSHKNKLVPLSFLLSTSEIDLTIVLKPGCVLISLIPSNCLILHI